MRRFPKKIIRCLKLRALLVILLILRGGRMLEFCRADHIIEYFDSKVCWRKHADLKIVLRTDTGALSRTVSFSTQLANVL